MTALRLHSAKSAFGVPCASPFATKAESFLRLSGVPYTREDVSPVTGPRKKIPYLTLLDGRVVSDSRNIEEYLRRAGQLELAPCALDTLVRRLVEEHLYFAQVYYRWTHHPDRVRDELFAEVPPGLRHIVFAMVRRQVRRDLWGQGIGRRPEAEILALVEEDLSALECALDDRPFFGGDALSSADCAAHGLLDQLLACDLSDDLTRAVRQRERLVAYHRRVNDVVRGEAARR